MKRCGSKPLLFLLLGAIINVVVAWGCIIHSARTGLTTKQLGYTKSGKLSANDVESAHAHGILDEPDSSLVWKTWNGLGVSCREASRIPGLWPGPNYMQSGFRVPIMTATSAGLPLKALGGDVWYRNNSKVGQTFERAFSFSVNCQGPFRFRRPSCP